jgi:hypothetical protein
MPAGEKKTDVASFALPVKPLNAGPISPDANDGSSEKNTGTINQTQMGLYSPLMILLLERFIKAIKFSR